MKLKTKTFDVLERAKPGVSTSRYVDLFLISLILTNVLALVLETVDSLYIPYKNVFETFELVSVLIFSLEYVLRIWSCTASRKYHHWFFGRLKFAFTPLAIFDLLAVLPFYLPLLGVDMRFARMFRFLRLARIAKLGRYSESIQTVGETLNQKKSDLAAVFSLLMVLLFISSCLMYFIERDAQPQLFSSIPATMWWAITTLSTVGYGDMTPVTPLGKIVASFVAVVGIGFFALPAAILGAGFVDNSKKKRAS